MAKEHSAQWMHTKMRTPVPLGAYQERSPLEVPI